jgi:hypothetical protein|tara:strand:+ start:1413 stop:2072 length:660 start_codon:yes stop_codon:yes gene_type:complete
MSNYFRRLPNLEYVSRLKDSKISDYIVVKNLFKKGILREDIYQNISTFEKYKIIGDDRPDNVAKKIYNDPTLDWLVLVSNNIINIQSEWPLKQLDFDEYLLSKYETYENLHGGIHHYETKEIVDNGVVIMPKGLWVDEKYEFEFKNSLGVIEKRRPGLPITNYEYESELEDAKRSINVLKPKYVSLVIDDLNGIMEYKKGSTQYVNRTLKRGDNIKLYN